MTTFSRGTLVEVAAFGVEYPLKGPVLISVIPGGILIGTPFGLLIRSDMSSWSFDSSSPAAARSAALRLATT